MKPEPWWCSTYIGPTEKICDAPREDCECWEYVNELGEEDVFDCVFPDPDCACPDCDPSYAIARKDY